PEVPAVDSLSVAEGEENGRKAAPPLANKAALLERLRKSRAIAGSVASQQHSTACPRRAIGKLPVRSYSQGYGNCRRTTPTDVEGRAPSLRAAGGRLGREPGAWLGSLSALAAAAAAAGLRTPHGSKTPRRVRRLSPRYRR